MKLVRGAGSPNGGACWMTALHYYTRQDTKEWTDKAPWACVDHLIRGLCITLNDWCLNDDMREDLIGPHLFAPIGTKNDSFEVERRRSFIMAKSMLDLLAMRLHPSHCPTIDLTRSVEEIDAALELASMLLTNHVRSLPVFETTFWVGSDGTARDPSNFTPTRPLVETVITGLSFARCAQRLFGVEKTYGAFLALFELCSSQRNGLPRLVLLTHLRDTILAMCAVGERAEVVPTCSKERLLERLCK